MSTPEHKSETETKAVALPLSARLAGWIDDPFASVIVGTIAPTVAVIVVFSGISGLGLIH